MFLYASGFVDAQKYSFDQWTDAFASSRQADGSYLINKEQWLEKKKFHYRGKIDVPFDPMIIEERDHTEEEVTRLLADKILPGTIFDKSYLPTAINNLKAQGKLVNGKLSVDLATKKYLLSLMNQYPSPLRVLQVTVHKLKQARKGDRQMTQDEQQQSAFIAGASAQQIAASRLSDMMKSTQGDVKSQSSSQGGISLKDLQKKKSSPKKI